MGRVHRVDEPGMMHFVTNRGTAQTMVFRTDRDRRTFLSMLGELETRFAVRIVAYVLMGNHYHLIVVSVDGRLPEAMHFLDGNHARRFNGAHERTGALFEGRYDSRPIRDDAHLERAGIYLHLNPLAAGLTSGPLGYPWSSLDAYAAGRAALPWLHLDLLAGRSGEQYLCAAVAELEGVLSVDHSSDDDVHAWCSNTDAKVDAAFAASDSAVAQAFGASVDELYVVVRGRTNIARTAAIVRASRTTGQSLECVAQRYGLRSVNAVYSAVRRLREQAVADPGVALRLDGIGIRWRKAS